MLGAGLTGLVKTLNCQSCVSCWLQHPIIFLRVYSLRWIVWSISTRPCGKRQADLIVSWVNSIQGMSVHDEDSRAIRLAAACSIVAKTTRFTLDAIQ